MSQRQITPEPSTEIATTSEPEKCTGFVIAVAPPFMVAKSKRLQQTKAAADRSLPTCQEIAASCRTWLIDYLTGTAQLPIPEAEAAADRAVRALVLPSARDNTKLARLITLLRRRQGATITELVATTGWQAHSVRGALSGTLKKKMGLAVTSEAAEGGRIYRLPSEG